MWLYVPNRVLMTKTNAHPTRIVFWYQQYPSSISTCSKPAKTSEIILVPCLTLKWHFISLLHVPHLSHQLLLFFHPKHFAVVQIHKYGPFKKGLCTVSLLPEHSLPWHGPSPALSIFSAWFPLFTIFKRKSSTQYFSPLFSVAIHWSFFYIKVGKLWIPEQTDLLLNFVTLLTNPA